MLGFILFFSARRCSTVILPCPRIFPLYSIKRENRRLLNFHVITTLHKVHASTCLIAPRTRTFFFLLFASVVLINCTLQTILFYLSGKKNARRFICLSALSAFPPPLLGSVFALCCCVFQCTGRHSGCSRLDCYSDRQRASACFLFVWHEQRTSLWQACSTQKVHQTHERSQFFCCFFFSSSGCGVDDSWAAWSVNGKKGKKKRSVR